jgi:hypothetical protein
MTSWGEAVMADLVYNLVKGPVETYELAKDRGQSSISLRNAISLTYID